MAIKNKSTLLLLVAFSTPSFAYIDPGSISLALQAILAAIAGLASTYRLWIYKVKKFFGFKKKIVASKRKSGVTKKYEHKQQ